MPDILSQEEKEALLQAFGGAPEATAAEMTLAIFPSVHQLGPEETALLHQQLESWAGRIAADLSRQLQTPCTADFPRIQTQPFSSLIGGEELPFWASLDGDPQQHVLLTLSTGLAASICERSYGGPLAPVEPHPLSPSETRLLQQLTRGWQGFLSDTWRGHTVQPYAKPPAGATTDPEEALGWLRFTVELQCGAISGNLSLCLAPSTVRRAQVRPTVGKSAPTPTAAEVATRLGKVPIELCGILGRARFSLDELASLRVGDVIFLDQRIDALVEVQIGGKPRFQARAGLNGQSVALELVEPYVEAKEGDSA